ncbi:MAG: response regulator [Methanomassiliicoccales archaeon]
MENKPQPLRILMVDDNSEHISLCEEFLPKDQFVMDKALDAAEALRKIGRKTYDLIVLDYSLPDMNGIELLKKVKPLVNAPVIFTTAYDDPKLSFEARRLGVKDYVVKTFGYYKTLGKRILDILEQ